MANIIGLITINNKEVLEIDAAPAAGLGTAAPVGSIAMFNDAGVGKMYIKAGALDTEWDRVLTDAESGIAQGDFLRLPIYNGDPNGNTLDDVVEQNGYGIDLKIEAQPLRSVAVEYLVPNPGNAIASAEFILSEGAQSKNGDMTFNDNVIVGGDLTVNGTLTYLNSTNTEIKDKLVLLNKGGAAASAGGAGLEFEEDGLITGYLKVAADRNGYEFLAPNVAYKNDLDLSSLSANRVQKFADASGTFVMRDDADVGTAGQVAFYKDANKINSESNLFWDASNDRLGIGTNAPSVDLHVNGDARIEGLVGPYFVKADALGNLSVAAVDLASGEVTGVLPVANGGTNSSTALNNNRIMISSSGAIVEHKALTQGSVFFADANGLPEEDNSKFFWDNSNKYLGIGTGTPSDKIHVKTGAMNGMTIESTVVPSLGFESPMLTLAHSRSGAALQQFDSLGAIAFSGQGSTSMGSPAAVINAIAFENFTDAAKGCGVAIGMSAVGGVMPMPSVIFTRGSTRFNSADASKYLDMQISDSAVSHAYVMPLAQGAANEVLHNDGSGNLSWGLIDLTADVDGVLPIANGGTNSSTALNDDRIMISSAGAIVEHKALTEGSVLFVDANGLPEENNSQLFWDNSNGFLGINTNSPAFTLDVNGNAIVRSVLRVQGSVGFTEMFNAEVSTTDATPTNIILTALGANSEAIVEIHVVARKPANGDAAAYVRTARVKKGAGSSSLSFVQTDFTSEDVAAWDATIAIDGSDNVVAQVTGVAANNIDWRVFAKVVYTN